MSRLTCSTLNGGCAREPPLGLADHERLEMRGDTGAVGVGPAGGAEARRAARHRDDGGIPALVQGAQPGHPDRLAPGAVALADHEPLEVTGAVRIEPAGGAVARRGARHRGDAGIPARVQRTRAGHPDRLAPGAVALADHERLEVTGAVQIAA